MRGKGAESEVVEGECDFAFEVGGEFCVVWGIGGYGGTERWGWTGVDELVDIVDDCFQVVGGLLELAGALKKTGLVVEDGGDECPFDGLAASCRVLQHLLGFV